MNIKFDKNAEKYIKEKKIDNIVIQIDKDSKGSCCGLGSVDFEIYTNAKEKVKNFKMINNGNIDIYYEPAISFYFKDDEEVLIKLVGFLNFKKLYVSNEINILK